MKNMGVNKLLEKFKTGPKDWGVENQLGEKLYNIYNKFHTIAEHYEYTDIKFEKSTNSKSIECVDGDNYKCWFYRSSGRFDYERVYFYVPIKWVEDTENELKKFKKLCIETAQQRLTVKKKALENEIEKINEKISELDEELFII